MIDNPKVIQAIQSFICRGKGIENDPIRKVMQIHTLDGAFIAENDPIVTNSKNFCMGCKYYQSSLCFSCIDDKYFKYKESEAQNDSKQV